ncbi:hypothetical protein EZJ49_11490 [Bdellovibrio bacteriovorus]|uniref:hypothetical protein n=1 Tax=Bdellovibrio bacteriovorus TaxID=959 RepID=UPI0021D0DA9F|nr:hypothetical protein [Bdellovibrio bacteriovorus]UXR63695.1 hypothetical protein EZJ49_11490 [Bdellovibrio bacteriovorus]
MTNENQNCHLFFPWNGDLPSAEVVVLRDVEIVGVGALRRHQLETLKKTKKLVVQTHEPQIPDQVRAIYDAELLRTLEWLRPFKVEAGQAIEFQAEQWRLFELLFPKTRESLGVAADRLRNEYLQNMEWSSWLLQDHWRYFVGFLRQKFPGQADILELAHWEWVQAWIEIQPFDGESASEPDVLSLNPSLQIVTLTRENPVLKRDKGMYAFVYNSRTATVGERPLDLTEALFIDLLQEDRKYSKKQLLEMAALGLKATPSPSAEELEKKFLSLVADDILKDVP